MNPYGYQPDQKGYPQQYLPNVGFNNRAPQTFGMPQPYGGPQPSYSIQGYPQSGYPQPGYPPQGPPAGYPPQNQGSPSGYPPQNPGPPAPYPLKNQGPPAGYPSQNPGPPAGYPPQNQVPPVGYPTQNQPSGYPPQQGYPQASNTTQAYCGYPPSSHITQTSSYPTGNSPQHGPQGNVTQAKKPKPMVVPFEPFNPRSDAEILRKAMKGFGTDEKSIIQLLTRRTNEQRLRIAFEFKTLYGKDLIDNLKSELSGNLETLVLALMTPLPQFYAKEIHDAMSGIGTDEDVLVEVMCTMSNNEIRIIQEAYAAMYRTQMVEDLKSDTSGSFERLMVSLCCANRAEGFTIDSQSAKNDAKALLQAGELRFGTDESEFNRVLCSRSWVQLAAVFHEYENITGHGLEEAIKNEFSGDIKDGLLAIVKVVRNRAGFFAERLHKSMKGLGTNDRQLIRIMVTRSEVDLADIQEAFNQMYGESLQSWIEGDCSGHYKKCLLALLHLY